MRKLIIAALALASASLGAYAQTDNPRGVYKLTSLIDKTNNKILPSLDQYKICTDSVTLTVVINEPRFVIGTNDASVFDYTGEAPAANNPTASRIYDSDANHFTLKWWSANETLLYPKNDWCTEFYSASERSEAGKALFEALMTPAKTMDKKQPLYGNWRRIGLFDEMVDVKEAMKNIKKKGLAPYKGTDIVGLTPSNFIYMGGQIFGSTSDGKTYFETHAPKADPKRYAAHWLDDNYVVIEIQRNQFRDYELWGRITDDTLPLNHIAKRKF
mgnify:FL=1